VVNERDSVAVQRPGWTVVAVVCLATALVTAAASAEEPLFIAHTVNGTGTPGPLAGIGKGWSIELGGSKPDHVRAGDLISLRRAGASLPSLRNAPQVILPNGDCIPGKLEEISQDRLRIEADLGISQSFRLPISSVAVIWFQAPGGQEDRDGRRFRRRLLAQRRKEDVVFLKNADTLEGSVIQLDAKALTVQAGTKSVTVDRARLAAVAFSTELMRAPRTTGPYGRVVLANGCRLSLVEAQSDGKLLMTKTVFGAALQVPIDEIVALDVLQGRAIYLSSLKPRSYEYTPFLGTDYHSYVADGDWKQADLRLAGSYYDRGLGMHSKSTITFDLAGRYRRLEALVGIDDGADSRASARIEIRADGKVRELARDGLLTKERGPRQVRVDLAGAKELTLVVDWGRRGFVQGRVNWADARLIK